MQLALLYGAPERFSGADQMRLANVFVQVGRPHSGRQGLESGLGLKQVVLHQAPSRIISTSSGYSRRKALLSSS